MYEIHEGLDCAGYVGWAIYNTLETKSNHGDGYVLKAEEMTKTLKDTDQLNSMTVNQIIQTLFK